MPRDDLRPKTMPYLLGKIVFGFLFRCYLPLTIEGDDDVPSRGAFLLVSNHLSNLDPLVIGYACRREVCFLSKQEVFRIPLVSYFVRGWGTIPFNRSASDASAVRAALRVVRLGKILGIFPEATRSRSGKTERFGEGVAKLAIRFDLPIIPVGLSGTYSAMPRGTLVPRPARLKVRFGAPFRLSLNAKQIDTETLAAAAESIRGRVLALLDEGQPAQVPETPPGTS